MSVELEQKVQSLQHSILFLQDQHSKILTGLYGEIERLQEKCSELTFQLSYNNVDLTESQETGEEHSLKTQLENEIRELRNENERIKSSADSKEKRIRFLEEQIKSKEQRYHDDLKNTQRQIGEIQLELHNKSDTIAYLTSQLRKKRRSLSNETNIQKNTTTEEFIESLSPVPPAERSPTKRFNLRRRTVVSPAAANVAGMIEQSSSHQLSASIEVLENSVPKSNSTRFPSRYKQSIIDPPRPAVGHSQVRRERELKLHNRNRPTDYEDFIRLTQSNEVVVKPSAEPLPPITTRSGRQLREAPINLRRSTRILRSNKIPTANAGGGVETLIKDTLSSPERQIVGNVKNSRGE